MPAVRLIDHRYCHSWVEALGMSSHPNHVPLSPRPGQLSVEVIMFSIQYKQQILKLALLLSLTAPAIGEATTVRMMSVMGAIDIILYDNAAPRTVANFLNYVNSGSYNNS